MKNPEEILSEGDWVAVDCTDVPVPFDEITDGQITDMGSNGCVVKFPNFGRGRGIYWEEVVSPVFRCEQHGEKIYHDKQETWLCPHCEI